MPQIAKGGKHVFAWSRVGKGGCIAVPLEAREEYDLKESENLIMIPGSRTSGGFGLASAESMKKSPISGVMTACPELEEQKAPEGKVVMYKYKPYCWIRLRDGCVTIPPETLGRYGVSTGDKLLVIRGSGLAVGFAAKGPILLEADRHPELDIL